MSYTPGIVGDPTQLAQRISSNIQKITQCYLGNPAVSKIHMALVSCSLQYKENTDVLCVIPLPLLNPFYYQIIQSAFPEETAKERNLVSWESQTQPQVQVQDDEITEDDLHLIHERESSIRQLEADIMDINEIFKNLGMMIHEQGDVIDSIEANVENAEVNVQHANQHLSRAAEYQHKSRKTLCIIISILVIGVVIIGLIIWAVQG
ncbi:syntaxin-7 [Pteropus vampyrus]|uniref:Syntaxin-7 n=1 Tax=Pteropus vampyrus TaxID=132908 RepID=A0A6P3QAP7_PTEVA|nr:syntaxin-7 [Pteropus vampyrus]